MAELSGKVDGTLRGLEAPSRQSDERCTDAAAADEVGIDCLPGHGRTQARGAARIMKDLGHQPERLDALDDGPLERILALAAPTVIGKDYADTASD
jgi:hypothetical protein